MTVSPFALGATLYMPATRHDILEVVLQAKIPRLRSMVICLEDAVAEHELSQALKQLHHVTQQLAEQRRHASDPARSPLVFIRPRHTTMAEWMLSHFALGGIDGLVLPKFTHASLTRWEALLQPHSRLLLMPTLETQEVFDATAMQALASALSQSPLRGQILALRIGGNDLMSVLGLRRSRTHTLYDGPLGYAIKMLSCLFTAHGFSLSAPVCELLDHPELLRQELSQDLLHGLVGKTAIHPSQIPLIQSAWMVDPLEYEDAIRLINSRQAVYKHAGAMCEPATHRQWAHQVLARTEHYGLRNHHSRSESVAW